VHFPFEQSHGCFYFGLFEPETKACFRSILGPSDVFLDIGANIGYFAAIAADRVGPRGKVFAFEPEPEHFRRLKRLSEVNPDLSIQAFQAAVSDRRGTATFFVCEHAGWHSLIEDFPRAPLKESLTVETWSLDDFLRSQKLDHAGAVRLAKVDVEGAEAMVIRGAKAAIENHWVEEFYIEVSSGQETGTIFEGFNQAGYQALRYDGERRNWVPMRGPEEISHMLNVRWVPGKTIANGK
jgi:FkbM family methyltransferase